MNLQLPGYSLKIPDVVGHPNRLPFVGELTLLGVASDGLMKSARSGRRLPGRKFVMTREAAQAALPSLLGAPVNCRMDLGGHELRSVVGVLTLASVNGDVLSVAGILFAGNFPGLKERLASHDGELGMSYELGTCKVEDEHADVWTLTEVMFAGATILMRSNAAFGRTGFRLLEHGGVGPNLGRNLALVAA